MFFKMFIGNINIILEMKNREEIRKEMFLANEQQKELIKKRELFLKNEAKEDALQVTHEISRLEDFIKTTENDLRMTD